MKEKYFVDMFHFTHKEKFPHRHVWMMISPRYSSAVCCVKFGIALNVILSGSHYRFLQGMFDMNDETVWQLWEKEKKKRPQCRGGLSFWFLSVETED